MDQIYIPKKRANFGIGSYVVIKPLEEKRIIENPFFYNISHIEPIKIAVINEIFKIIEKLSETDNIIITGSFLEKGFRFNDIDVIIVVENSIKNIEKVLENRIGANFHVIVMNNRALIKGLETDPLYRDMLTKCIARKRFIYKAKPKINYKLLDLHLIKSKALIDNFDFLTGDEKYTMTRNLIAINQFVYKKGRRIDIDGFFGDKTAQKLRDNTVPKDDFLVRYKKIYKDTQNKIFEGINNEQK